MSPFLKAGRFQKAEYLIANPPYLPCKDRSLLTLPDLCGGPEGNGVSKSLLSYAHEQACPNVFMEVSSYSNPAGLIEHATGLGFKLLDFQVTHMPIGVYSRQDVVWYRLHELRRAGQAHFTERSYLVGSALFTKAEASEPDLSSEFLACLSSIRQGNNNTTRPPYVREARLRSRRTPNRCPR